LFGKNVIIQPRLQGWHQFGVALFKKKLNDNPLPLTRFGSIEALLFRLVSLLLNSFSRIVEDLTLKNSPARGK